MWKKREVRGAVLVRKRGKREERESDRGGEAGRRGEGKRQTLTETFRHLFGNGNGDKGEVRETSCQTAKERCERERERERERQRQRQRQRGHQIDTRIRGEVPHAPSLQSGCPCTAH